MKKGIRRMTVKKGLDEIVFVVEGEVDETELWKLVDSDDQNFITIEHLFVEEDEDDYGDVVSEVHFIAHSPEDERNDWEGFINYIVSNTNLRFLKYQ